MVSLLLESEWIILQITMWTIITEACRLELDYHIIEGFPFIDYHEDKRSKSGRCCVELIQFWLAGKCNVFPQPT
jgi:hypothetical protein